MSEKTDIEKGTAEGFIKFYNETMRTSYRIVNHSDSPDFQCVDSDGNELNLEMTTTEPRHGDTQAILGRSDYPNIESLQAHRAEVEAGRASDLERVISSADIRTVLVNRIQVKLKKDYGPNTALVVRDLCPADPDWNLEIDDIKAQLDLSRNPFDKGIWILWRCKDRLFRLV